MKNNIILVLSTVVILSFTGCVSSPSPWSGLPFQEAKEWRSVGVSSYSARHFRANGFTMYDIKPWIQAGIKSPKTIIDWKRAGFEPYEASNWMKKRFTLKKAIELKKQGLSVN